MSKNLDLKAIFGDPMDISAPDSPVYQFHDHMDEVYISGLPENFPCHEFEITFSKIASQKITPLPAGIWFAGHEEGHTTIVQMIFEDMVERDLLTEALIESVDRILCDMGVPLSEQSYYMVPMTRQNYDDALIYANSLIKPSSDLN